MNRYVLGFLFDNNNGVWLINKTKPDWQKGKLNGIGGKVEGIETPFEAMIREFKEETGVEITNWKEFCIITDGKQYEIFCYSAFSDKEPQTTTDEVVGRYDVKNLPDNVLFNSYWLIPMATKAGDFEYIVKECFTIANHDEREVPVVDDETEESNEQLSNCEQCGENAWDGRICHACGVKDI